MGNITTIGLAVNHAASTNQSARTAITATSGLTFSPTLAESMAYHADQLEWSWDRDYVTNYRSLMQNRLTRMIADLNAALDTELRRSMADEVDDDPNTVGAQNSKTAPAGTSYGFHYAMAKGAAMQQYEDLRTQAVVEKSVPLTKGQLLGIPLGPTISAANYDPVRAGLAHRLIPKSLGDNLIASGLSGGVSGIFGAVLNWLVAGGGDKTLAYDIDDNDVGDTVEVKVGTGGFWSTTNYLKQFQIAGQATSVDPTFSFMQSYTSESRNWYTGPFNSATIGGGGPGKFLRNRPGVALRQRLGSFSMDYSVIPDKVPNIGPVPVYYLAATAVNFATIDLAGLPIPNPNALFGYPLNPGGIGAIAGIPVIGPLIGGIVGIARDGLYFGSDGSVFDRFKNAPGYGGQGIGGLDPYILNNSINWWDKDTAMDHPLAPTGQIPFLKGQLFDSNSIGSIGQVGQTATDRSIYENSLVVTTSTNKTAAPVGAGTAAAQAAVDAANTSLQNALNALSTAQTAQQSAQQQVNTLQAQLQAAQQAVTDAQNAVTAAQNALTNAQNQLTQAQNSVTQAQNRVTQAQTDLNTAQTQLTTDQNNLTATQNQLTTDQNQLASDQAAQTTAQNNLASAQAAQTTACAGGPSPACTTATNNTAAAQTAVNNANTAVNNDNTNISNDQGQITALQGAIMNDNQNITTAQQNLTNAQNDLAEAQTRQPQAIADANTAIANAQAQLTAANAQLAQAQSDLAAAQANNTALANAQATLNSANASVAAAQAQVNAAQAQLDAANAQLSAAQAAAAASLTPQYYDLWGTVDESKGIDPATPMDYGPSTGDAQDHSKDYTSSGVDANPDMYMMTNDGTQTPKKYWGTSNITGDDGTGLGATGRLNKPVAVYGSRVHQVDGMTDTSERLKNLVAQSYDLHYDVTDPITGAAKTIRITPTSFYDGTSAVNPGGPVGGINESQYSVLDNDIDNYLKFQDRQNAKAQARLSPTFGNQTLGKFRATQGTADKSNVLRDLIAKYASDPLNAGIFMLGMAKDIFVTASASTANGDTLASSLSLHFTQAGTASSHTTNASAVDLLQGGNNQSMYANWGTGLDGAYHPTLGLDIVQERYTSFQTPR